MQPRIRQRDFVEDSRGWVYAVVLPSGRNLPAESLIVSLRYRRGLDGVLRKLNTQASNDLVLREGGGLMRFVAPLGCEVAVLDRAQVGKLFSAQQRVRSLLEWADADSRPSSRDKPESENVVVDDLEAKAVNVAQSLVALGVAVDDFGITGSMLVGAHGAGSDLDFVFYSKRSFEVAQELARNQMRKDVGQTQWQDAYEKRSPTLSFDEFLWHEVRKANKFWLEGTKVDFSLSRCSPPDDGWQPPLQSRKIGSLRLRALVTDDQFAFDTPAQWTIDCSEASRLLCWTATYTGQAKVGEEIEIVGCLEETEDGRQVVVGSSREAEGEFIRVVRPGTR